MSQQLSRNDLDCLKSLRQAADDLAIPIVLVGATARWLVFNRPLGIPLHRTTTDWDFGVRVPTWPSFSKLWKKLIEQEDAFAETELEHRLLHKKTGTQIDLVPFGELEDDGRIRWPKSSAEMNVVGFADAYETAVKVDLSPDFQLSVATVPILVALKFFAFADRKNETDRDLSDLWHVIKNYVLSGREDELYQERFTEVVGEDFDWDYAPPLLLGYDVNRACQPSTVKRLLPILRGLTDPYSVEISKLISRYSSADREEAERQEVSASFLWVMKGLALPK